MTRPIGTQAWRKAAQTLRQAAQAADLPCALCGQPIDWQAPPRTPWAFTADHITERDAGGHLTDPHNLRPAHYRCNSQRGAHYGNSKRTPPTPTPHPIKRSKQW